MHSSLPISITNKNQNYWTRNYSLTISINYGMIGGGTCPKFWGNRPQQPKILKRINFYNLDNSCLPTSTLKKIKTIEPATENGFLIISGNFDISQPLTPQKLEQRDQNDRKYVNNTDLSKFRLYQTIEIRHQLNTNLEIQI